MKRGQRKQFCIRGHDTFICGRSPNNSGCNTCINENNINKRINPADLKHLPYHTIETANKALVEKGLNKFLFIQSINGDIVTIKDADFGSYKITLQSLAPSMGVPLHRKRKHLIKLTSLREKYVGKQINSMTITDIFYGKDRGYKNRSFLFSYIGTCGHSGTATYAHLTRWKKSFVCELCSHPVVHGERKKIDGVLKRRTSTYNFWLSHKDKLPKEYQDFEYFKTHMGEKPFKRADLAMVDNKLIWINLSIDPDNDDLNLIAMAIRQVFRFSFIYKECINAARIETEKGTRYKCASCGILCRRKDIQVDHIESIVPLDGSPLKKEGLIDKIWTKDIQVLDRKCHLKKSTLENKQRKQAKDIIRIKQLEERLKNTWIIEEGEIFKKEISTFLRKSVSVNIQERAKNLYNIINNKLKEKEKNDNS